MSVDLLSLFLLLTVFCMCGRVGGITTTHERIVSTGGQLGRLGSRLRLSGTRLGRTGRDVTRGSCLGRRCVNHCVSRYSICLRGVSGCHQSLKGVTTAKGIRRLCGGVGSSGFVRKRLGRFCAGFSGAFLRLFPAFMRSFGTLLTSSRRVSLGTNRQVGARLHVFTLVHLNVASDIGVTRFLQCSIAAVCGCHAGIHGGTTNSHSLLRRRIVAVNGSGG